MSAWGLYHDDALVLLASMDPASVDAIVTDPPYGLGFMGKAWDHGIPGELFWIEALRVAKPGAHLVAFGGTRTYHRLACAIEDAGWEVRDSLMWLYGSGFPKSLDVSKAIDKAAGAKRSTSYRPNLANAVFGRGMGGGEWNAPSDPPATEAARTWEGWGTALKPAWEPIILARKPLVGTVAANVLEHGTGALNVDGCRIGTEQRVNGPASPTSTSRKSRVEAGYRHDDGMGPGAPGGAVVGRWPANVLLDEEAAALLDEQSGGLVSRFFYCAKAAASERHAAGHNTHPTVKPVKLMRWLCRLVTPPDGLVLDPFCGSGSTGVAALAEGFRFLGFDSDETAYASAQKRLTQAGGPEWTPDECRAEGQ